MIEQTILAGLMAEEEYLRKVIPFLKDEYFDSQAQKVVFDEISKYVEKYNSAPNSKALEIAISSREDLNEALYKDIGNIVDNLKHDPTTNLEWLIDETEKFCQDRAVYNAVRQSILVLDGKDKKLEKGSIPKLLSDALAVTFDSHIGHDFAEDFQDRYDFYHLKEDKIECDLEYLNKITKGGFSRKSLSVFLGGTGTGKTLVMCHLAGANYMLGKNVLYITMEMAEERIAERIDANLLDVTLDDLRLLTREVYASRIERVKKRTTGRLVVKEYPTASAGANHFRFLLNELKLKQNFLPDVIYIDYLNICSSSRIKHGANVNSYTYIKAIAEELRGLAVEFNVPILTATQTTRSGYGNSDVDLTDTSESFGLPATADFMAALITSEDLESMGQLMVKQLKNRWGDISSPKRFVVGIDRSKMRLFDAEESAQEGLTGGPSQATPKNTEKSIMDKSDFGSRLETEMMGSPKKRKRNFKELK